MLDGMPPDLQHAVKIYFAESGEVPTTLNRFSFCGGGCINHGGRLETSSGDYFIKWNDLDKFPAMFEAESRGLGLLRRANSFHVPHVIHSGKTEELQFLILTYTKSSKRVPDYWTRFGEDLAALHRNASDYFGLDHDNYIGSLPQRNSRELRWTDFFIRHRLEPQLELAKDKIDLGTRKAFGRLFAQLPALLPAEKPSLLHGDLWSGNIMVAEEGQPSVIDPAVYFGHREADLAMTELFGGFDSDFLEGYNAAFPLENGFMERFDIYNLYPLLVHVNLFGGGYAAQVQRILKRFV
jgi:protein-ribulosamine 3-kinase